jgi:TolA-binding protein
MYIRFLSVACAMFAIVGVANTPLDRAKELFDDARYNEAYEALMLELDGTRPSHEVFELATKALLGQGRIVTAQEVATKWVQTIRERGDAAVREAPQAFYFSGRVAAMNGETQKAVSRYTTFVQTDNEASDHAREALVFLLLHEPNATLFEDYVKRFGGDPDVREVGINVATLLLERTGSRGLSFVESLLNHFPDSRDACIIIPRLKKAIDDTNIGGLDSAQFHAIMKSVIDRPNSRRRQLQALWNGLPTLTSKNDRFALARLIQFANNRSPLRDLSLLQTMLELRADNRQEAVSVILGFEPIYREASLESHADYLAVLAEQSILPADQADPYFRRFKTRDASRSDLIAPLLEKFAEIAGEGFLAAHLDVLSPQQFGDSIANGDYAAGEAKFAEFARGRDKAAQAHAKVQLLRVAGDAATARTLLSEYLGALADIPGSADTKMLLTSGFGGEQLSAADSAKVLSDALAAHGPVAEFAAIYRAIDSSRLDLRTDASYQAARDAFGDAYSAAGDVLTKAHRSFLANYPDNRYRDGRVDRGVEQDAADFLREYTADIAGSADSATDRRSYMAWEVAEQHRRHSVHDPEALGQWGAIWGPRLSAGKTFEQAALAAAQAGTVLAERYAEMVKAGARPRPELLYHLTRMDSLGIGKAGFVPIPHTKLHDREIYTELLAKPPVWARDGAPSWFTDLMLEFCKSGEQNPDEWERLKSFAKCHWQYNTANKPEMAQKVVDEFIFLIDNEPVFARINAINEFIENSREATDILTLQHLLPLHKKLTAAGRNRASVLEYVQENLEFWQASTKSSTEQKQQAAELQDLQSEQIVQGLGSNPDTGDRLRQNRLGPAREWMLDRIRAKDWMRLAPSVVPYAQLALPRGADNDELAQRMRAHVTPVLNAIEQAEADELAYLLVSKVKTLNEAAQGLEARMSRAALQLNIIPVERNHPAYRLHQAASELARGNAGMAWEQTEGAIPLLMEHWQTLNLNYLVWTAEQLRKSERFDEGLGLAFEVLAMEGVDDEVYAAMSIVKGDIYRDNQNFDAARIEYQALADNSTYNVTRAGRQAQFRLIDLMIDTRSYHNAEDLLQKLMDNRDLGIRAEAYYLMARINFAQEVYDEAKKNLDTALLLKPGHPEALLLDGELRLFRQRGLAAVEIELGEKQLKTVLVPGRPLRLTLPDRNLGVVRKGKKVPVIVTTTGGDREELDLYPSTTSRTTFSANISTTMGTIEKGNRRLEIFGDDEVTYQIAPEFQDRLDLSYPAKTLEVKAEGSLVSSAGIILTPEEIEKQRLEQRLGGDQASGTSDARSGNTVRPGSPVYVQVIDLDRNTSKVNDEVWVNLETSSGDKLRTRLLETEIFNGTFNGEIKTGIPFARADVSDAMEGNDPNVVICSTREGSWHSQPIPGPKWLAVDSMTSHEMKEVSIKMPDGDQITRISLEAGLIGDTSIVASIPEPPLRDGLFLQVKPSTGGRSIEEIRRFMGRAPSVFDEAAAALAETATEPAPDAPKTVKLDTAAIPVSAVEIEGLHRLVSIRATGMLYLPFGGEYQFDFAEHLPGQDLFMLIDDTPVISRYSRHPNLPVHPVEIEAGVHRIEILAVTPKRAFETITPGVRRENFAPLRDEWFTRGFNEELAEALKPNVRLERSADGFTATFREPVRYRKLQWNFDEYGQRAVQVDSMRVVDVDDKAVIPVEQDFTAGLQNEILEVAPGDEISVSYHDEKRLNQNEPILYSRLNAAYANGAIALSVEIADEETNELEYFNVRRCRIGDTLVVVVNDSDEDQTPGRDKISVIVETSGGETLTLEALEDGPEEEGEPAHTGVYKALLRLGDTTEGDTIKIGHNQTLTVKYLDRENLSPGVPAYRETSVTEAGESIPTLAVAPSTVTMNQQTGDATTETIDRLLRKAYNKGKTDLEIWARQVVSLVEPEEELPEGAVAPTEEELAAADEDYEPEPEQFEYRSTVDAPISFSIRHPAAALHAASKFEHVKVVTQSELDAAKTEMREPEYMLLSCRLSNIEEGTFGASIPLRIGSKDELANQASTDEEGDAPEGMAGNMASSMADSDDLVDELGDTISPNTLFVKADDTVILSIDREDGANLVTKKVFLGSDGILELMERSRTARSHTIHIGDTFYLRLSDSDRDATAERDTVEITATVSSGDVRTFALSETFGRSGIFEGKLDPLDPPAPVSDEPEPEAADSATDAPAETAPADSAEPTEATADAAPTPELPAFSVQPGDTISFAYTDSNRVVPENPEVVLVDGMIRKGASGELAAFSKRFQDPEMAVKTSFLMAESLFEMAKDQRKLRNIEESEAFMGEGKQVLEEALRDFPDTSLVARGEFLLANLAQELKNYDEAIRRYTVVASTWPDTEYAPQALFKKALCLERKQEYDQALEEYVRLTYIYKGHSLASDAVVRLASYYYKQQQFDTSARIFAKFQEHNPHHRLAAKSLALAGLSHVKGEDFPRAMTSFRKAIMEYPDQKDVRSESMYWLGDTAIKATDYVQAYRAFKQLTWDYPETKWAKMARGRMTENVLANQADNE